MHFFLVCLVMMGATAAQIRFPGSNQPYTPRPLYPVGQRPGLPGQRPGFPGQLPGVPGRQPGLQQPGLPGQFPGLPGQQPGLPVPQPGLQQPGFPGQFPGLPGQQPGLPVPQPGLPVPQPGPPGVQPGGLLNPQVHFVRFGSDYHYSWRVPGAQLHTGDSAKTYCETNLGKEWLPISIETPAENEWVKTVLTGENQKYIWTSGRTTARSHPNFLWATGTRVGDLDWSFTGSRSVPQPDNAENNIEHCLAVLNNFYEDGVRWHDVACYHPKPVICERVSHSG